MQIRDSEIDSQIRELKDRLLGALPSNIIRIQK